MMRWDDENHETEDGGIRLPSLLSFLQVSKFWVPFLSLTILRAILFRDFNIVKAENTAFDFPFHALCLIPYACPLTAWIREHTWSLTMELKEKEASRTEIDDRTRKMKEAGPDMPVFLTILRHLVHHKSWQWFGPRLDVQFHFRETWWWQVCLTVFLVKQLLPSKYSLRSSLTHAWHVTLLSIPLTLSCNKSVGVIFGHQNVIFVHKWH